MKKRNLAKRRNSFMKRGTIRQLIIKVLSHNRSGLTLDEISDELGLGKGEVFKSLKDLYMSYKISSDRGRYYLNEEKR